ncbi:unnamed protein product [Hyaloperonospora brassicae]|uniref:Uncharacterized protein n=1 Tax=Hyaloperonospora brassicae TaxID=162125 RepID=A0AAV0T1H3_HYABA|nr:unnamed protein product [Hyaloperonospora brassicae]
MVLTRAQAAGPKAVGIDGDVKKDDGEIDAAGDGCGASLVVSDQALVSSVMDHVAALAQQFLLQTQVLARERAVLQYQQEGRNHAQNAALMAVQASTETSVRQLTGQQRDIAVKFGEALTAMQASLREQLQHLQNVRDERGGQLESNVCNDSPRRARKYETKSSRS